MHHNHLPRRKLGVASSKEEQGHAILIAVQGKLSKSGSMFVIWPADVGGGKGEGVPFVSQTKKTDVMAISSN